MHKLIIAVAVIFFTSCTTVKLPVSEKFSSQATKMKVKGLNGWMVNQKLSFGPYQTSRVKRGWDFTSSVSSSRFSLSPEEAVLRVFDINTDKNTNTQTGRFQYSIENGSQVAEVFATERFQEKQLVYRSHNPWIGSASKTNRYEYAFNATILPLTGEDKQPWSLVLINRYDIKKDTAKGLFRQPYVEEEGYATNGQKSIAVRSLRADKATTSGGKDVKLLGGKLLSGYEISQDGEVVGVVDILDNNLWLANELGENDKLIVSSIASAILLKRMQDVEKDRDSFDRD